MAGGDVLSRYDSLDFLEIRDGEEGRGLFVKRPTKKREAVLIVPFSSLLHAGTADSYLSKELVPRPVRPSHETHWRRSEGGKDAGSCKLPLTSVQALTLILAQWHAIRRTGTFVPSLSSLDVFLGSYPTAYSSLPLFWQEFVSILDEHPDGHMGKRAETLARSFHTLLKLLPSSVASLVADVRRRFTRDVGTLEQVMEQRPDLIDGALSKLVERHDMAWAWASVNTRCVYLPLGLKPHGDNFTLAPLLDMANHTFEKRRECKVEWLATKALQLSAPAGAPVGLGQGEQVFISYGAHSNGFLLAEYGFVMPYSQPDKDAVLGRFDGWTGNPYCEVQVDDLVDQIILAQGKEGLAKKKILLEHGYWHDYTLHPHPSPVHPSYRLVIALRLLAVPATDRRQVERWIALVQGEQEGLGAGNDKAVVKLLVDMCETVVQRAYEAMTSLDSLLESQGGEESLQQNYFQPTESDFGQATRNVRQLHEEEMAIAQLLLRSARQGSIDWL